MEDLVGFIRSSGHVHSAWYLEKYPDVAALKMNPAEHYLRFGALMGRNPGRNFDTRFYLAEYPDAAESGLNPLVHYLRVGQAEGRRCKPAVHNPRRFVDAVGDKLWSLGFTETPLAELEAIATDHEDPETRATAARELAIWHLRSGTRAGRAAALDWVGRARELAPGLDFRIRLSVIELLCFFHLGDLRAGRDAYHRAALDGEARPDLLLARANLETSPEARLIWINQALAASGIAPLALSEATGAESSPYDRLIPRDPASPAPEPLAGDGPKVTVLVAAYEAAGVLPATLRSLQAQSWRNLEILVLDDCSPGPETAAIAEAFARDDPRIRLIRMARNGGAYVARNHGLDVATGEFVTLNDADDWAHPQKIETQVRFLLGTPQAMGCTSQQARATADLDFTVLRERGAFIIPNISSFMFRRAPVMAAVGYWDNVRFGADVQFIRRVVQAFGKDSVHHLKTGPLAFQRTSPDSATGHESFGYDGFKFGARKIYEEAELTWLERAESPRLERAPATRPFFAPAPMRPDRPPLGQPRRFDVVIASDFRFPGGTTSSNAEEIKAQRRAGLTTGLIELSYYKFGASRRMDDKIASLIDGNQVELLCHGETIDCDTLILRQPMAFNWAQRHVPNVRAKRIRVIVNQPPMRDYGPEGVELYNLRSSAEAVRRMFGNGAEGPPVWHPIGPLVREALLEHHAADLDAIALSDRDWHNIIDIEQWKRPARPEPGDRPIRIGRHSRDDALKWPADPDVLLAAYPPDPGFEIHVLGGAEAPRQVLEPVLGGALPENWRVQEFGAMAPHDFLAGIDIFVYYAHPDWVEAFGRVIFEPMCVGVPCILPPVYEKLFGPAALYAAQPADVVRIARDLYENPDRYEGQVRRALDHVRQTFSYDTHVDRLKQGL